MAGNAITSALDRLYASSDQGIEVAAARAAAAGWREGVTERAETGSTGMAIYWSIDSVRQLMVVTAEGEVTRSDVEVMLDAVVGAGALGYRKIFDALQGTSISLAPEDLLAFGVRFQHFRDSSPGPLAIVLQDDKAEKLARVLGILATTDRPMRLFTGLEAARRWIERFAPSAGAAAEPVVR